MDTERLGNYVLLEPLSKGGMGQVFVAQRDGASEVCVLKQLLSDLEEQDTATRRFHREARATASLNHPNIAKTIDAGFEDGTFCIAMELIPGKDLEAIFIDLLEKGRLIPYEVSLASMLGALDGLHYAHNATDPATGEPMQLVHRDLSPRNIMLSADGVAKVIDFGVARSEMGDFKTTPGYLVGTLRYCSPEQACAEGVDHRSDLYSVSVVLHEMLTGKRVIPGGPNHMDVLRYIVSEQLPLISELNPQIPEPLAKVVQKGMAKNVNDRWQSGAEYAEAIRESAGKLASAPPRKVAKFLKMFFAEDIQKAEAWVSTGRERYSSTTGSRQSEPINLPTRTGFVASPEDIPDSGDDSPVMPVDLTTVTKLVELKKVGQDEDSTMLVDRSGPSISQETRTASIEDLESSHSNAPLPRFGSVGQGSSPLQPSNPGVAYARSSSAPGSDSGLPVPMAPTPLPGTHSIVTGPDGSQMIMLSSETGSVLLPLQQKKEKSHRLQDWITGAAVMAALGMGFMWYQTGTTQRPSPATTNANPASATAPTPEPPSKRPVAAVAEPPALVLPSERAPEPDVKPKRVRRRRPATKRRAAAKPATKAEAKVKPVSRAHTRRRSMYLSLARKIESVDALPKSQRGSKAGELGIQVSAWLGGLGLPPSSVTRWTGKWTSASSMNPNARKLRVVIDGAWQEYLAQDNK